MPADVVAGTAELSSFMDANQPSAVALADRAEPEARDSAIGRRRRATLEPSAGEVQPTTVAEVARAASRLTRPPTRVADATSTAPKVAEHALTPQHPRNRPRQ